MKRLLLCFLFSLVTAASTFGQGSELTPYLGNAGRVTVRKGTISGGNGVVTIIPETTYTPTLNATTYIYIDLATPVMTTNNTGFPISNCYPIATVVTNINGVITSFTDNRPNYFMGTGGISGAGPVFNAKIPSTGCAGCTAVGDAQKVGDGVTSNGANATVTSASAKFLATDVGKKIFCVQGSVGAVLPISTITGFTSTSIVTTNGTSTGAVGSLFCTWYTQDDTAALLACTNAAQVSTTTGQVNDTRFWGKPFPATCYVPFGGYVVSDKVYYNFGNAGQVPCANMIGDGIDHTVFFTTPTFNTLFLFANQCVSGIMKDWSVFGSDYPYTYAVNSFFTWFNGTGNSTLLENLGFYHIGTSGASQALFNLAGSVGGIARNIFVQNSPTTSIDYAADLSTNYTVENSTFSNHLKNVLVTANGGRTATNTTLNIVGGLIDECTSTTGCLDVKVGGFVNLYGTTIWSNVNGVAMAVDGTSEAWLVNVNCGTYNNGGNGTCATIASGGIIEASGSSLHSNGAGGFVMTGPAGATFVDEGGNDYKNCLPACTTITVANYTTVGFSGGIIPKSTQTHTPNTCYAVNGNLLATAQNICTLLLDQNYQLLNITAQSGGTTPANSACATPPVITLSDGTRTATMTMTTAKTQWKSTVDSVTNINQVFATGTTLTVSIGANTCATPPVNVSVNYNLQSIINP